MTAPNSISKMTPQDWLLLILLSLIWGGSFLFARIAVLEVPPLTLVLLRVSLAAIALNAILFFFRSGFRPTISHWLAFAGMGLLNNILPFSLIFYGQTEIGAGLAAIVNAMTPIWTILVAHAFTKDERMSSTKIFGTIAGFAGVAILIGVDVIAGLSGTVLAQIAVLGATVSYAFASVFGRRFANIPPIETARGQLTMSSLIMLPIAAFYDQFWTLSLPGTNAIWAIILLAFLCTAFAYILFFRLLASAGAVNISLVTFLVPLSAIAFGILLLGEHLAPKHIVGMMLIMLGLVIIDGRLLQWIQKKR